MSRNTQIKIERLKHRAKTRKAHACLPTFEQNRSRWRDGESLGSPWLFLPMEGRAQMRIPDSGGDAEVSYAFSLPVWFGQVPTMEPGLYTIPRERFTQVAELAAERFAWIDLFTEMDQVEGCEDLFPQLGWSRHCELTLPGGNVEIHSVLFEGHSYEGMFE